MELVTQTIGVDVFCYQRHIGETLTINADVSEGFVWTMRDSHRDQLSSCNSKDKQLFERKGNFETGPQTQI